MKKSLILSAIILFSTFAFAQSDNRVISMENAEHFSVGSFATVCEDNVPKKEVYKEVTFVTSDGGTGMLLKFGSDELSATEILYAFEMKLFPNPTSGYFSIETNAKSSMNILIYDVLGNIIFQSQNVTAQYANIDLSQKSKGIYIVKVQSGDYMAVNRLAIQ